jgi:3'-phosphoadenosine 5'-phosphosulfate sulfotransferase (PAPS reductase)/FAD synthetase
VVPAPDRPGWLLAGLSPAVQGSRTALEGYRWLELNAEQNRGYRHMTTDQQEAMIDRLPMLLAQSHGILDDAIKRIERTHRLAGIVILFSGGNDSTVLAHMFRKRATVAAHANTSIGIEQTRQFVRDTCGAWELPLIEKHPKPGETYRDLVLGRSLARSGPNKGRIKWAGFPGPAGHRVMYNTLKQRAMEAVRNDLITNPRKERVIFLSGVRNSESSRRSNRPTMWREGSVVWVQPLGAWNRLDLNDYRRANPDVPRNEVADLLHMSGECLCGAFAHAGELDEIREWFPEVAAEIRVLESEVLATGLVPPERCRWGWGAGKESAAGPTGPMCSTCDARWEASQPMLWPDDAA